MSFSVKSPPPRAEWHFDDLPEVELWACYHYEYARSHETLSKDLVPRSKDPEILKRVNELLSKMLVLDLLRRGRQKNGEQFVFIARQCPEFPATPWQAIPSEVRKLRLRQAPDLERQVHRPINEHELPKLAHDLVSDRAEDRISPDERPREFAVVRLDWELSDREIRKKFESILKHRPYKPKKTGGRTDSPIDGLHALGALRLKNHYRTIAKVMAAKYQGVVDLKYSEEAALRTAVRRAEKILASM